MTKLFSPLSIKSITLKNRIGISPMCQYMSVDGFANDWHLVHLGSRAIGGAGLIITEACAVEPNGRISPDCLGLYYDSHIEYLARITAFIKKYGAIPGIQLAHAGRKGSSIAPFKGFGRSKRSYLTKDNGGFDIFAPSPIPFESGAIIPHELTIEQIHKLISQFGQSAKRALKAGFQWLEIHAAHGYLINSFYSPLANQRQDKYGGSFDNRIRFLIEVIDSVKANWSDEYPVSVRLSITDHALGGFTIDDSVKLAKILKSLGIDLIDCSSGHVVKEQSLPSNDLKFQIDYAKTIKHEANIMTMAVGNIDSAKFAAYVIDENYADIALIARTAIKNPYFAFNAALELGITDTITLPQNYTYAI